MDKKRKKKVMDEKWKKKVWTKRERIEYGRNVKENEKKKIENKT